MLSGKLPLIITQGATFDKRFEYKDSDGSPIDLTGYQARMQLRSTKDASIVIATISSSFSEDGTGITFTPLSGSVVLPESSGSFRIQISAYSSSLFDFSECESDLFIYSGSGVTQQATKLFDVKFKLQKSATR